MTPESTTDNTSQTDASPANYMEPESRVNLPDGDSEILQLFAVGDKQQSGSSTSEERVRSGGHEKEEIAKTRQRRFSVPSKVGGKPSQIVEKSKHNSIPTTEKHSTDLANGKVSAVFIILFF